MIDWAKISLKDLAGYICEELKKNDIEAILVGGACVTIYSQNRYLSYDLDFVTYEDMKKIKKVLVGLGFVEKGRSFWHEDCPWFLDFVSPPVAVGNEPIKKFNHIETPLGTIKLLRPVESVKDRLASFYHWNDKQSLEQAVNVCLEQDVNLDEVKRWSIQEGQTQKFNYFKERLKQIKA